MPDPLLVQHRLDAGPEGDKVVLYIGNAQVKMHYTVAAKFTTVMHMAVNEAKRNAQDFSTSFDVLARLTDANVDEANEQAARDATAVLTPPKASILGMKSGLKANLTAGT